jgi:hypothetical protein
MLHERVSSLKSQVPSLKENQTWDLGLETWDLMLVSLLANERGHIQIVRARWIVNIGAR